MENHAPNILQRMIELFALVLLLLAAVGFAAWSALSAFMLAPRCSTSERYASL